jgi:hypothetical protein
MSILTELEAIGAGTEKVLCLRSAGGPTNLSGAVTDFPNSVSGGSTFSESSSLTRPVYVSDPNTDGNGPAWLVDTGDRGLISSFTPAASFTVLVVFKIRSGTATDDDDYRNLITSADSADFNPAYLNIISTALRAYDGTSDLDGNLTLTTNTIICVLARKNGTTFDMYVNGTFTRNATIAANVPDSLCFMSANDVGSNGYQSAFGCTTYAMAEFDSALSNANVLEVSRLLLKEAAYGTQENNYPMIKTINTTADTSGTSVTVAMPASITAGDLLLVFVSHDTDATIAQSGGSDWTIIENTANGTAVQGVIFAKIAAGSDSLTITDGADNNDTCCISVRISNHGVTDVSTDITKGTAATGTSATPDPPDCAPGVALNYLWLEFFAADDDDISTLYASDATNFIPLEQTFSDTGTSSCMCSVGYKVLNATSVDPGTMTMAASEEWIAQTLAIPVYVAPAAGTDNSPFFGMNF